eukprot:269142-Heterocapsa_arctica.AAC.1
MTNNTKTMARNGVMIAGDPHLCQFLLTWEESVEGVNKEPAQDILESLLLERLEGSTRMSSSNYRMASPGSSKHSYKYLYDSLVRYIIADAKDKNRAAILAAKN